MVILNKRAFDHAKQLINEGKYVLDDRDEWSEHQPTPEIEDMFLEEKGFGEYSKWYLGLDDDEEGDTKKKYRFPYGDFIRIHCCGVIAAESRAAQYKYEDIHDATVELHDLLESAKTAEARKFR